MSIERRSRVVAGVGLMGAGLVWASPAFAHGASAYGLWGEPWVTATLMLSALLYARGWYALPQSDGARARAGRRAALFSGGWLTLVAALVSPLASAAEGLFSAHMIQHELLMVVAAPLLVLGRPLALWTWGLPAAWRGAAARIVQRGAMQRAWRMLTRPMPATIVHAAAIWIWHIPAVFERSESSAIAHALQHAAFFFSAVLFWWAILRPGRERRVGPAVFCLFVTMLHTSALGVLLTYSSTVWYPAATAHASEWGLTALEAQQLGGLVMWVPGGIPYVLVALGLSALWFTGEGASKSRVAVPVSTGIALPGGG